MKEEAAQLGDSAKAQIARAAGLVMALFVVSRALGLLRQMVISHQFGSSGALDAYLAAFRLPDILFQLVAGGALASAFIPTFSGYLAQGTRRDAWRLASAIINLVLILTVALGLLGIVLAPWLVSTIIAPGFDAERQALTVQLMRLMLITPVVFGVSGVVMGILHSFQHFLLPALAPAIYNLGIIAGAVFLAPGMGVMGLAWGVVLGSFGHLLVQVPGLVRFHLRYTLTLGLRTAGVHEVGRLMLPRVLGLAAVQINFLVNTILASGLAVGSLSALSFAWLLMLLPQGVFAQAVATAAFPTFATQAAKGLRDEMRSTLGATLRAVLYLSIPAAMGLVILRTPLVQFLFEGGKFGQASTQMVAWALGLYALGLPAHSVVEIVVRAFYALHDTKTPVGVGIAAMVLNVALSLAFLPAFESWGWMPLGGLALSNTLATTVEAIVLLGLIRPRLSGLEGRQLAILLGRSGLAAALMATVLIALVWFLGGYSAWLVSALGIAVGLGIYGAATVLLGAPEPRLVWSLVTNRRR